MLDATKNLSSDKAKRAFAIGLNRTISKVNTQTKRAVASQMGVTQSNVVKHGGWRVVKAHGGSLEARVTSSGAHLPLKDFRPAQGPKGVRASPWNTRRLFGGTFLNAGKRAANGIGPVGKAKAGGHVFRRNSKFNKVSKRNNAIEILWGPAVPKEMVRDESKAAFERIAATDLPIEVERAVKVLTKGVLS